LDVLQLVAVVLTVLLYAGNARPVAAQSISSNEYPVKAAFLFHFAQFVDWPDGAFQEANSPLVYCTIGEDEFKGALEASLLGKKIDAHPIQIRHTKQISEIQGCHVLFLGEGEKKLLPAVMASLRGSPVLIVGESERFVQDGGMIGFFLEENKIRFEVNLESAEKAQLRISAKLLALAKIVIGRPRKG
jgi:uncharacterized protein DUF4154